MTLLRGAVAATTLAAKPSPRAGRPAHDILRTILSMPAAVSSKQSEARNCVADDMASSTKTHAEVQRKKQVDIGVNGMRSEKTRGPSEQRLASQGEPTTWCAWIAESPEFPV